jgi:hypothetical protein
MGALAQQVFAAFEFPGKEIVFLFVFYSAQAFFFYIDKRHSFRIEDQFTFVKRIGLCTQL